MEKFKQSEPQPKQTNGKFHNETYGPHIGPDAGEILNIFAPNELSDYNKLVERLEKADYISYCDIPDAIMEKQPIEAFVDRFREAKESCGFQG